jgi:hypothetical protein
MKFIEVKNQRVLDILERFRYLYREKYDVTKTSDCMSQHIGEGNHFTSEEYLNELMKKGSDHDGLPGAAYSHPIKPQHYNQPDAEAKALYRKDFEEVNDRLKTELGLQSSALSQLYPPQGFIDWHNNANAASFNVIFTWSETGDGWFKWVDNGKINTMHDKKGWSCKVGYFASYEVERPVIYHCAYTDCYRITLSFTLGFDQDYWLDMVDYIKNEE